jgi:phosphatidylinositol-3-phosphatase
MRSVARSLSLAAVGSLLVFVACGSSGGGNNGGSSGHGGSGGGGGQGASGGTSGTGGASGTTGSKGTSGAAGTGGASGSSGTGGASGSGGSGGTAGDSGGKTLFPAGTICNKTGTPLTPPSTVQHVVVFLFENQNFGSVNDNAKAPYMSSMAKDCAFASAYDDNCFSGYLASEPHYLALTSGSNCDTGLDTTGTGCITDDADATIHTLTTTSIFAQASSWKSYQESMPSNCDQTTSGNYACKHNPAAYYSTLSSCSTDDVPIAAVTCPNTTMTVCSTPSNAFTDDIAAGTLAAYSFITPNLENDMHNGTVTQGDNWLYTYLPLILKSTSYLNGEIAIFVLWDQQGGLLSSGGPTPNFFVSPYITAGTVTSTLFNHFSALLATEKMLGITTYLGCASGTQPGGGACPTGSTADLRSAINF